MNVGAWFLHGYRKGMAGTLGQSLDLDKLDNLGWALRAIKYELLFNGYRGDMVLDSPVLGDAADAQIREFQREKGKTVDGIVGPETMKALLFNRLADVAATRRVPLRDLTGIVRLESGYDVGAIGTVDHADRGLTQKHIYPDGSVNLGQAIRPALALPRLADQLGRARVLWDNDAAVASWNIGEGGAEWWYEAGEPAHGSPSWWRGDTDMSARATRYVQLVRS